MSRNKKNERPFSPFSPIICKYPWEILSQVMKRGDDIHVKIAPTSAEQQAGSILIE